MTGEHNALAQVRRLFAGVDAGAVTLAAELLDTIETGRDLLAPVVDEDGPAGIASGIVFQLLSDAAASAAPPAAIVPPLPFPASRNGFALMLSHTLARVGREPSHA